MQRPSLVLVIPAWLAACGPTSSSPGDGGPGPDAASPDAIASDARPGDAGPGSDAVTPDGSTACLDPALPDVLAILTGGGADHAVTGPRGVLSGTAPALIAGAATERVTVNDDDRGVAFDPATGRWSWHGPLAAGANALSVRAHSAAGWAGPMTTTLTLGGAPAPEPDADLAATDHTVGAWFFSWFTGDPAWECSSPWWPVDGFAAWDGSVAWAKGQLLDMMDANLDVVGFQFDTKDPTLPWGVRWTNVERSLEAVRELLEEGYRPPRVIPFLDTAIVNALHHDATGQDIDVSTEAGRAELYDYLHVFFTAVDTFLGDRYRDAALATLAGRPMIAFWHTDTGSIVGGSNDFVLDLKARFLAEHGVTPYVIGHPNHFAQWAATDEVTLMFGPPAHFHQGGRDGAGEETINLTPGFWNPISNAWYLPRLGGSNYDTAWATAQGRRDQARHLYIDSWNETGEGSGVFAALLSTYTAADTGSCGTWVYRHDDSFAADASRHYIDVTAAQAAAWNDVPEDDALFLAHDLPATLRAGERRLATVVVRNTGDRAWTGAAGDALRATAGAALVDLAVLPLSDALDEIPDYGGLFRGRPRAFTVELRAPCEPGNHGLVLQLHRGAVPFGEALTWAITVE
jgi:hypothetical protein